MRPGSRPRWFRRVSWTLIVPAIALVALAATWGSHPGNVVLALVAALLAGAVLAAVHHAEVVAHRVGEPLGSLVLAIAVEVIEVGLIVVLMAAGGAETDMLARDTVFAAAMITCNGIVGLCLVVATLRQRVATFNPEGTATTFATVITLATPHPPRPPSHPPGRRRASRDLLRVPAPCGEPVRNCAVQS